MTEPEGKKFNVHVMCIDEDDEEKKCIICGGIDKFDHDNICYGCIETWKQKLLASQKSEFENEKQELFAEWARQKIELTERNKNLLAKVLEIVDKAMQMTQKTKEAYIKHGQPTTKADYEIIVWTEIRRRFEEELK